MSSDLIDIEVTGEHDDTLNTLRSMGDELKVKAIRYALKFAGKPVVTALKSKIGGRGNLAGAVNQMQVSPGQRVYAPHGDSYKVSAIRIEPDDVGLIVGPNKWRSKFAFLGMLLETGAKPHTIGTTLASGVRIGGNYVGKEVSHPGFRGRPIFGPAFDSSASQIESRFYEGLERHLRKVT